MRLPALATRNTARFLSLVAAALFVALAGPVATQAAETSAVTEPSLVAQETTTSSTPASSTTTLGPTTDSSAPASSEGVQPEQGAIVPPIAAQVSLNPGWRTDQMSVRAWPEYDQKAVLMIVNLTLPADVALPAVLKFPIPTGARLAGIAEIDPSGGFTYNYADSYPSVEPGSEWDIATIDVKSYRQLQIDYYYDPGIPQEAGQRSFPLLAQMPMDVGTLVLHVQQPARATDFNIQPALQSTGEADDGFTYAVATYPELKAGSTLGHLVSYYKPDGGLSIDSAPSAPTQFNTSTVLLAAILVIVIIVGGLVVYRLYSRPRSPNQQDRHAGAKQGPTRAAPPVATKQQRQANKTAKGATPKDATSKGTATTEPDATGDPAAEQGDEPTEYCVACGEELTTKSRFCPNCGEARP